MRNRHAVMQESTPKNQGRGVNQGCMFGWMSLKPYLCKACFMLPKLRRERLQGHCVNGACRTTTTSIRHPHKVQQRKAQTVGKKW
jgi:hypothetical protein